MVSIKDELVFKELYMLMTVAREAAEKIWWEKVCIRQVRLDHTLEGPALKPLLMELT